MVELGTSTASLALGSRRDSRGSCMRIQGVRVSFQLPPERATMRTDQRYAAPFHCALAPWVLDERLRKERVRQMDFTRRGFLKALTSSLATAVPVALGATLTSTPVVEPEVLVVQSERIVQVPVPVVGLCRDCLYWDQEFFGELNYHLPRDKKQGFCENSEEAMITNQDFGCILFKPDRGENSHGRRVARRG